MNYSWWIDQRIKEAGPDRMPEEICLLIERHAPDHSARVTELECLLRRVLSVGLVDPSSRADRLEIDITAALAGKG